MRQEIFDALAARLQTIPGLKPIEDKVRKIEHVRPEEMPLIFITPGGEVSRRTVGKPAPPILRPVVVLYVGETSDHSAGKELNRMLDEIDRVLKGGPLDGERQTLGGRVKDCFVAGETQTDEGELQSKALAVMTIEIHP